ncbi:MAG TPA: hypothetical protein EYP57_08460 [Thermodesulfobacteriaceae bacterium]|nr:hypothetical protein [Thermodesulfobacteriaceae bacterium]
MRPELATLIRLQGIDLEICKLNNEKQDYPKRLKGLQDTINAREKQIAALKERLTQLRGRKIEVEDELELETLRMEKSKKKLTAVKTNREYQALQKEIEQIVSANSSREEELLAIMDESAAAEKETASVQKELEQFQKELEAEKKRVEEIQAETDRKIEHLIKDRKEVEKEVKPELLSKYRFLSERRAGIALAAVSEGVCSACNMNVPPQLYNELLRDEKILTCPSCQRLMYALEVEK